MAVSKQGFTGISFPFRIGNKGGVVLSSTSGTDVSHIVESMEQILRTRPMERCMEYHIKSDVDTEIFDINDVSTRTLISYQVKKALQELEDRIEVVDVETYTRNEVEIIATVKFRVLKYDTVYTETVKVGEIRNAQNT